MKVLLLGVTGNVGSRLLPALLARKHRVVAYVRSPNKLPLEASTQIDKVIVGSATDCKAIKDAILDNDCDAVVNAAGVAGMTSWHSQGDFPAIFATVVKATTEAGRERGTPVRCWLMSGFGILDSPKKPYMLMDYLPMFPAHKPNYQLVKQQSTSNLAWSLFCATDMSPKHNPPQYPASLQDSADNLIAEADVPPAWTGKFRWIPLVGGYLNVMSQAQSYFAVLEHCVDFIAADLEKGFDSEWIGKRVGVKEKSRLGEESKTT